MLLSLNAACNPRHDHAVSSQTSIVGAWRSEPFSSQFGSTTETFCFRRNGTISVKNDSQAGALENQGTYRIDDDRIIFNWSSGSTSTATFELTPTSMILTAEHGQRRRYARTKAGC
jgi:hypothetical protein